MPTCAEIQKARQSSRFPPMDSAANLFSTGTLSQILVGLSRTTILFIVSSGMSLILGVLRIPNVAHGSLYMIGAFAAWSVIQLLGADCSASSRRCSSRR